MDAKVIAELKAKAERMLDSEAIHENMLDSLMDWDDEIGRYMRYGWKSFPLTCSIDQIPYEWEYGGREIPAPETKDDLLKLAAALGVKLNGEGGK